MDKKEKLSFIQRQFQRFMNKKKDLRDFYILWSTQSLSQLGSAITAVALTLWLYDETGSSLGTAALRYVPTHPMC